MVAMINTQHDPFFKDKEFFVILPDREELSNGSGRLSDDLVEWMITNAPGTQFTYRRVTGPVGEDKHLIVFVFEREEHPIYFKMRWQ